MNLYVMRHGHREDAPDNPAGQRWPHGRGLDPDISSIGIQQAQETGEYLKNSGIKHIYASPFLRTVHTAHEIALKLGLKIGLEWGICEQLSPGYFSDWPGTICPPKLAEMFSTIDLSISQTGILPTSCPESDYWQMHNRAVKTAFALIKRHDGENILLVGHGAIVCAIPPSLAGWPNKVSATPYLAGLSKMHRPTPETRNNQWKWEINSETSYLTHKAI